MDRALKAKTTVKEEADRIKVELDRTSKEL